MIYCVVPPEAEPELYERLVAYYSDKPDVTVVIDRRLGQRRRERADVDVDQREGNERRRSGAGGFVSTDVRNP
ncbi:MAG TPA: hypothetical protein VGM80_09690 [Gaiellaceae bacterium]